MLLKHLYVLLLVVSTLGLIKCQNDDEPPALEENNNQLSNSTDLDNIEGSGSDPLEMSNGLPVVSEPPILEEIESNAAFANVFSAVADNTCPDVCTCSSEGDGDMYTSIVDCSDKDLTEIPSPIDIRATTLNLHNNKLETIPKSIAELKNLEVLIADNNLIKELALGSVSELSELKVLKLENNRFLDFPQEIKNSFGLTKLEEINLSGNDIRETMNAEHFAQFINIKTIKLTSTSENLIKDLCYSLNNTLQRVCINTESCTECLEADNNLADEDIPVVPGAITADAQDMDDNVDPVVNMPEEKEGIDNLTESSSSSSTTLNTIENGKIETTTEFSLQRAVNKEVSSRKSSGIMASNVIVDAPKETDKAEEEVKVGAASKEDKSGSGGVDKSIIGIVVAGMVVVVAAVVIKKNWTSIRSRFSSNPRPATDRAGGQANGTTPEEIPLQEKSPV